jgi:hypothetical protein
MGPGQLPLAPLSPLAAPSKSDLKEESRKRREPTINTIAVSARKYDTPSPRIRQYHD